MSNPIQRIRSRVQEHLTEGQIYTIFQSIDLNHDERIQLEEFVTFMKQLCGEEYEDTVVRALFTIMDKNHDRMISFTEFTNAIHFIETHGDDSDCLFTEYFKEMDRNNDGKVDVKELYDFFGEIGIDYSPKEARQAIEDMDHNHDGYVQLHEFLVEMATPDE